MLLQKMVPKWTVSIVVYFTNYFIRTYCIFILHLTILAFLVHLTGKYNGQVFEERDIQFCLGEGEVAGIVEGVEIALKRFLSGEKSKLLIKSKYAFKEAGNAAFNIPANADVEYEVELKNFETVTVTLICMDILHNFMILFIIDYIVYYRKQRCGR